MAQLQEPAHGESLWRGPVTSEKGARRIIAWTAWPFIALSLPVLYNLVSDVRTGDHTGIAGGVITLLVLNGLALSLLLFGSRVAAAVLLAIASLCALLLILVTAAAAVLGAQGRIGDPSQALILGPVSLMWLVLAFLSWRAVRATTALHRMRQSQPATAAHSDA
jgi:hypothetical protein